MIFGASQTRKKSILENKNGDWKLRRAQKQLQQPRIQIQPKGKDSKNTIIQKNRQQPQRIVN